LRFILDFEILYLLSTEKACVPIMNFAVAEKIQKFFLTKLSTL
jgi:hypothetical protein